MSVLAADTFNRADGALGANWTTASPEAGALAIVSNQVRDSVVGGADAGGFYSGITWANDQYSQVQILANATSGSAIGLMSRKAGAGTETLYPLFFTGPLGASVVVDWYKAVAGTWTLLTSGTVAVAVNDTIRVESQGSSHRLYVNGVQVLTTQTDAAIASGYPGFFCSTGTASADAVTDNWEGGDFFKAPPSRRRPYRFFRSR